jgi:hypothetical protein
MPLQNSFPIFYFDNQQERFSKTSKGRMIIAFSTFSRLNDNVGGGVHLVLFLRKKVERVESRGDGAVVCCGRQFLQRALGMTISDSLYISIVSHARLTT